MFSSFRPDTSCPLVDDLNLGGNGVTDFLVLRAAVLLRDLDAVGH